LESTAFPSLLVVLYSFLGTVFQYFNLRRLSSGGKTIGRNKNIWQRIAAELDVTNLK